MKLTYEMLAEKDNCGVELKYFRENFKDGVDIWEFIRFLEKKHRQDVIKWLFWAFKLTGIFEIFYQDGRKCHEWHYRNGLKHGICRSWGINGVLRYEENFKNGKEDGICRSWDPDGTLKYEWYYGNGKLIKKDNYCSYVLI